MERRQVPGRISKRKAENHDNERLSKRLSLLNLERNGQKLYVPVENPSLTAPPSASPPKTTPNTEDDTMRLDNTKHKVYIYNIDDELSDSDSDDGKLVFLPDIEKHLLNTRIPPSILANSEGELAGNNQLVLYNVPSSLTLSQEKDNVRKAIIETRARARANQKPVEEVPIQRTQAPQMNTGTITDMSSNLNMAHNGIAFASPASRKPSQDDPDAMDLS